MTDDLETTGASKGSGEYGAVTAAMVQSLVETRPWVYFIAVLGFVMAGFMVLAAIVAFAVVAFAQSFSSDFGAGGFVIGATYAVIYLVLAGLYLWISYYLYRYATAIRELQTTNSSASMELALDSQRSFWRLVGIMTAIYLACLVLALVVGFIAAIILGVFAANA